MPWPRAVGRAQSVINPVALKLAGRLGSLVDLQHVGRRSGATRHTPVRAFRRGDRVVVGANFGHQADWVKNVQAAGHAHMRMRGEALDLDNPRLVDVVDAAPLLPSWFRIALRYIVRTEYCVVFDVMEPRRWEHHQRARGALVRHSLSQLPSRRPSWRP